jgi:hypothetical protein
MAIGPSEAEPFWTSFLRSLVNAEVILDHPDSDRRSKTDPPPVYLFSPGFGRRAVSGGEALC